MLKRLKLYFLKRRIRFLEDQELELQAALMHVRATLLPNAEAKRARKMAKRSSKGGSLEL